MQQCEHTALQHTAPLLSKSDAVTRWTESVAICNGSMTALSDNTSGAATALASSDRPQVFNSDSPTQLQKLAAFSVT